MLRLGLLVMILSLAMGILISGAVWYGQGQKESNEFQSRGFQVCEGQSCYFGIHPNTRREKIKEVLRGIGAIPAREGADTYVTNIQGAEVYVLVTGPESDIDLVVLLHEPVESLTLGQFIAQYGRPCAIEMTDIADVGFIIYPDLSVGTAFQRGRLFDSTQV